MLNKAPIFINCFERGGSNIIQNIIASHPDVVTLGGELHQVFYGMDSEMIRKWLHRFIYLPVFVIARQHLMWHRCLDERNEIPCFVRNYIDFLLYCNKRRAGKKQFKTEFTRYSPKGVGGLRLLSKNPNGLAFVANLLSEMYRDSTFIGLVRNGFALCEGLVRRGWGGEEVGVMYDRVCKRMIADSERIKNYHVVRFEDMISEPVTFCKKLYSYAGLDIKQVSKFRLQAKKSMTENGSRDFVFGQKDREIHWVELSEMKKYFRRDVDKYQIARLAPSERNAFLSRAHESMEYFGYL